MTPIAMAIPPQRHNVRRDSEHLHTDERDEHGHRDFNDDPQRAPEMHEEQEDDETHNDRFFDERFFQCPDCRRYQVTPVVRGFDAHAGRQARGYLGDPLLYPVDDILRVFPVAHHDDAADDLPLSVLLKRTAADVAPQLHRRNIADVHGDPAGRRPDDNILDVAEGPDVSLSPDEVLGIGHLEDFSADVVVRTHDGVPDVVHRNVVCFHLLRVDVDLVLPHKSADGRNFRNALNALEIQLDIPILDRPERAEVVFAFDGVPENLADARSIRSELHLCP